MAAIGSGYGHYIPFQLLPKQKPSNLIQRITVIALSVLSVIFLPSGFNIAAGLGILLFGWLLTKNPTPQPTPVNIPTTHPGPGPSAPIIPNIFITSPPPSAAAPSYHPSFSSFIPTVPGSTLGSNFGNPHQSGSRHVVGLTPKAPPLSTPYLPPMPPQHGHQGGPRHPVGSTTHVAPPAAHYTGFSTASPQYGHHQGGARHPVGDS